MSSLNKLLFIQYKYCRLVHETTMMSDYADLTDVWMMTIDILKPPKVTAEKAGCL